jgi:hypothetical protein
VALRTRTCRVESQLDAYPVRVSESTISTALRLTSRIRNSRTRSVPRATISRYFAQCRTCISGRRLAIVFEHPSAINLRIPAPTPRRTQFPSACNAQIDGVLSVPDGIATGFLREGRLIGAITGRRPAGVVNTQYLPLGIGQNREFSYSRHVQRRSSVQSQNGRWPSRRQAA